MSWTDISVPVGLCCVLLCDGRCVLWMAARADAAATLSPVGMRGERNFGPLYVCLYIHWVDDKR